MASHPPLSDWLDYLSEFLPPIGHLVVGAVSGNSETVRYLIRKQAGLVALVEADGTAFKQLQTISSALPEWQLIHRVVARETGTCSFFHASLPSENGVVDPASLCANHGYKQIDQLSYHGYLFATELRRALGARGSMKGTPNGLLLSTEPT